MFGNRKVSSEKKLQAVKEYLEGKGSESSISKEYGVTKGSLRKWIAKYKAKGDSAFIRTGINNHYTSVFKQIVVQDYLSGNALLEVIAIEYIN